MRLLSLVLLSLLAACAIFPTSVPDFSSIGKIYNYEGRYGTASVVGFSTDGFLVLTCYHVVRIESSETPVPLATGLTLVLGERSIVDGTVVWFDPEDDTALVFFETDLRPALLELTTEDPEPYTRGYAAGYPMGVGSLVVGDVLFQTSPSRIAHLTGPGASGGPVFDENGKVCGIVYSIRWPLVRGGGRAMFGWITRISPLDSVIEHLRTL